VDELAALRRRTRCKVFTLDEGSAKTAGCSIERYTNTSNATTYNQHVKVFVT
jgi:hypothetical protein